MNKGNFTATDNFPVSTFTYDFLQNMTELVGKLTALGGANYILSGCMVDSNNNVSDGFVVISGEILPFKGGQLKNKLTIRETKLTDSFAGIDYPESYILRNAESSDTGEYNWKDFAQVLTNKQLTERIESIKGEPPGMVIMWSGRIDRVPSNYLLADGSTVRTDAYTELAAAYGMEHLESFKLPNLSGRFIVGYDGLDSGYKNIGDLGGAAEKVITDTQLPKHTHIYSDDTNAKGKFTLDNKSFPAKVEDIGEEGSSASSGGRGTLYRTTEAGESQPFDVRPPFYVLAYLIKVKY